MKIKNLMFGGMAAVFALTACQNNEDLYDPAKSEELLKSEYSANFFAKYGEVPADYSWDASSFAPTYQSSRATSYDPKIGEYYNVEQGILNWLNNTLEEKKITGNWVSHL